MTNTTRDTDFTNLQPGDEIAVTYTIGKGGTCYSGSVSWPNEKQFQWFARNAFVSKRQPSPLKPGDKFTFEHGTDMNDVRTLVFMDDKSILYTNDQTGARHCFPIIDGKNPYYGRAIRAS